MKTSAHNKGFLLIELLVALSIFSVVMLVATSTLLALLDANYKARALKSVTDNLNFAIENMSRNIRVGTEYYCSNTTPTPPINTRQDCTTGGTFMAIEAADGSGEIDYRYNSATHRLQRRLTTPSGSVGQFIDITAPEVDVTYFRFFVEDSAAGGEQPFVRIIIRGNINIRGVTTEFNLQTAVTQRVIDV